MEAHSGPSALLSVIVRARDEAASIGRCLELLRSQQVDQQPELIVVDNDSSDATAEIAAAHGAKTVSITREQFSFGRALNLGAEHASGEILVSLSAHAFPLQQTWLTSLTTAMVDPRVACASGERYDPEGNRLTAAVSYDRQLATAHPDWGYSNAAGAFRAELWRERPFREDLPACEDREWCSYWVARDYVCTLDPALLVDHDHTHDPLASIYRRARREAQGFAAFLQSPPGPRTPAQLVNSWWSDTRFYDSPTRARLSPRRAARLLGAYAGRGGSRPNGTRATRRRA